MSVELHASMRGGHRLNETRLPCPVRGRTVQTVHCANGASCLNRAGNRERMIASGFMAHPEQACVPRRYYRQTVPARAVFGPAGLRPRGALRGDRACRVRTLSSGSALWSPLPGRDANTHRTRWARGRASDRSCLTVYQGRAAGTDAPRSGLRADRVQDIDACRAWRARPSLEAVRSA